MRSRLGLVINPLAGIGGAVGLKGSDGPAVVARARALGGTSAAQARAVEALSLFSAGAAEIVTAGGSMGAEACGSVGLPCTLVTRPTDGTTASDTRDAVEAIAAAGADLLLFAGGDGTARDVAVMVGDLPMLGIPAGVKMYSGVFAATAAAAGYAASRFLETPPSLRRCSDAELLDLDEAAIRHGESNVRLFGTVRVPVSPVVQRAKAAVPAQDDADLEALCRDLAARLEPGCLHIVGPGRTTRAFLQACGLPKTLLGVDLMRDRQLVATDAGEAEIWAALEGGGSARIVVGLLGGLGCLFGRGNPQISARVLRRVGRDRISVLAGAAKVASLPHGLFVDTGDTDLDGAFAGFVRVETAPRRSALLRIRQVSMEGWTSHRA